MRLAYLRVKHFRCLYQTEWIPFHDLTVLIGENDGGKTATLHVLRILFSNAVPTEEDFSYSALSNTEAVPEPPQHKECMELEALLDLTGEEVAEFARDQLPIQNNQLHILRRCYLGRRDTQLFAVGQVPADDRLRLDLNKAKRPQLRELATALGLQVSGTKNQPYIDAINEFRASQSTVLGEISLPLTVVNRLPEFVLFDDNSNPESVVHSVLLTVFREELQKPGNAKRVQSLETVITRRLRREAKTLTPFVRQYREDIKSVSVAPHFNFEQGFRSTTLRLQDNRNQEISLLNRGTGIKRHITLAVYEWNSKILKERQKKGSRALILAFDEPDTSLDYHSQRKLFDIIQGFVGHAVQIVVCTHSVNLINRSPIENINYYSIERSTGKSVVEYFSPDKNDTNEVEFFLHKLGDGLGLHNALMFHERCFLLFEGETEEKAVPIMFRLCMDDYAATKGVRVINAYNNDGVITFAKFLNRHKRPVVFAIDEDTANPQSGKGLLTKAKLEKAGIDIKKQVFLVGPEHFEFAFSDDVWARAVNSHVGLEKVSSADIKALRKSVKQFVPRLLDLTGASGKPELGLILARSLHSKDEIPGVLRECFQQAAKMAD